MFEVIKMNFYYILEFYASFFKLHKTVQMNWAKFMEYSTTFSSPSKVVQFIFALLSTSTLKFCQNSTVRTTLPLNRIFIYLKIDFKKLKEKKLKKNNELLHFQGTRGSIIWSWELYQYIFAQRDGGKSYRGIIGFKKNDDGRKKLQKYLAVN